MSTTGLLFLSITFVPIGAFSSTKPSTLDDAIIGGLLSTGFTVMVNLAVADRFASDTSTALINKRITLLYVYIVFLFILKFALLRWYITLVQKYQRYHSYLDDNIELLGNSCVDRLNLLHGASVGVYFEKFPIIRWIATEERIMNRCVYTIHINGLYFLRRYIKYPG